MKSSKIWLFVSYAIPFVGLIKCLILFFAGAYAEMPFWIIGIAWITWLIFSFRCNKNLPGIGPFNYRDGENQEARTIYTVAVVMAFLFAVIFT